MSDNSGIDTNVIEINLDKDVNLNEQNLELKDDIDNSLNLSDSDSFSSLSDSYITDDSNDSNNKLEKIKKKEENIILSDCYVCFDPTMNRSVCECKTFICHRCFIEVILRNGDCCTICKNKFDTEIVNNIRNAYSEEVYDESVNNSDTLSLESDDVFRQPLYKKKECICLLIIFFAISIPFLGYFISELFTPDIKTIFGIYIIFLIGVCFWVFVLSAIFIVSICYVIFECCIKKIKISFNLN